jgi:hypothetical protein
LRSKAISFSISTLYVIGLQIDSFTEYALNTELVLDKDTVEQDTIIAELFNHIYEIDKKILKYGIQQGKYDIYIFT